jgi:hypothetical protein
MGIHVQLYSREHGSWTQTFHSQKWGEKIIEITWKFVLNCWNIRNGMEHNSDGDPIGMKKGKARGKDNLAVRPAQVIQYSVV